MSKDIQIIRSGSTRKDQCTNILTAMAIFLASFVNAGCQDKSDQPVAVPAPTTKPKSVSDNHQVDPKEFRDWFESQTAVPKNSGNEINQNLSNQMPEASPQETSQIAVSPKDFSDIPKVVSSDEKMHNIAKEESKRIAWLFNAKNYEAVVQEYTSDKYFLFSDSLKIGLAFYATGRYQQASIILLAAEKHFPNDTSIKMALGDSYYASGDQANAIIKYSAADLQQPNNFLIKNILGNAYYALGDQTNAIKSYRDAEILQPKNTVIKTNLGNAYYALGDPGNAIKKYREALTLEPENTYANRGVKRIEEDQRTIAEETKRQADSVKRQAEQAQARKAAKEKSYDDIYHCKYHPEDCR